ncbi:SAM-dependent methyltransferase [Parafrankia discariae]|uniref:SAM-dependent methyltransferase n=1 Tax=Parafrankia discariae TaxID=365528 RepID=UPI00037B3226|nr:SAM-dependent methyltransferase [Parafrankia discariae]
MTQPGALDPHPSAECRARVVEVYRSQGIPATVRSRDEVARFFDGLDLVEPGVRPVHRWRPDDTSGPDRPTDAEVNVYGALARLP